MNVIKWNNSVVEFSTEKIKRAIILAMSETKEGIDENAATEITSSIEETLGSYSSPFSVNIIQDIVEEKLMESTRKDVAKKYQENLGYYSSLSLENQRRMFEEIYTDIERYRGLVDVIIVNDDDEEFIKTEMETFNNTLRLFSQLIGDDSYEEPERTDIDIPVDSNVIGIDSSN